MSTTSKTPGLEKNYSEYRKAISELETPDLKLLLEWCSLYEGSIFKKEIKAIKEELDFRNTSLGRELD